MRGGSVGARTRGWFWSAKAVWAARLGRRAAMGALLAGAFAVAVVGAPASSAKTPPQIWLAPLQQVRGADGGVWGAKDYGDLFAPHAPWPSVANAVSVFKIYPSFITGSSDAEIVRMWRALFQRHIALALEAQGLERLSDCTPGLAKDGGATLALVTRLKRLGVSLSYIAMNGPLVSGHRDTGPGHCRASIPEVAADSAGAMAKLRAVYPGVKIGDIESLGAPPNDTDPNELQQWMAAYRQAAGYPLAFVHLDVTWGLDWRGVMIRLAKVVHAAGVPLGVIYNGDSTELSDADWAANVERHYTAIEALPLAAVDQVIFQSWNQYPRRVLPETLPTSETGIVKRYLRTPTRLERLTAGRGRLTETDQRPVAHARLRVEDADEGLEGSLMGETLAGVAPHGAARALFAIRVNAECACELTPTRLRLTNVRFRQPGRQPSVIDLSGWETAWPGVTGLDAGAVRIDAQTNQKIILNSPTFPVSPDARFTSGFSWRVGADTGRTGYAAIIFLDPSGHEIHRVMDDIAPTWSVRGALLTDANGRFQFPEPVHGRRQRLVFAGDPARRSSTLPLN